MIKWATICFWYEKCKLQDGHDSGSLSKKASCNKRGQHIVYQRALWAITMEGRELSFLLPWVLHKFWPGNFTLCTFSHLPGYRGFKPKFFNWPGLEKMKPQCDMEVKNQ